jgi:5'(3')-deoxyribonucleotidase
MKIGIDVDDVLADFIPAFRIRARELTGKPNSEIEPCDWAWSNFGLTKDEMASVWSSLHNEHEFHLKLNPLPHTDSLTRLYAEHELYFITARFQCLGRPAHIQTAEWIRKHYGIEYPVVIVSNNKAAVASAIGLDYFIDDRAETCEAVAEAVENCTVVIKDREHNRYCQAMQRVANLNELARRIPTGN